MALSVLVEPNHSRAFENDFDSFGGKKRKPSGAVLRYDGRLTTPSACPKLYLLDLAIIGPRRSQSCQTARRMLENDGIVPKFSIELSRDALRHGVDTQLHTAVEAAKAL